MVTVRNFTKRQDGASAVEFAIVLPVLLLVVFGIMDFGRAFYVKNNVVAAVREGARVAAAMDWTTAADQSKAQDSAQARIRRYLRGTISSDADTTQLTVSTVKDGAGNITVRVIHRGGNGYLFEALTPYANKFNLLNARFDERATFRYERQ